MTTFAVSDSDGSALDGVLHYIEAEYSFRFDAESPQDLFERVGDDGVTSLLIGTLQIEVAVESGAALFVWGLHPHLDWHPRSIGTPVAQIASLRLSDLSVLQRGVSIRIARVGEWTTFYDEVTGWIQVSSDAVADADADERFMIATGTVLGLRAGGLHSIWLHPVRD